VNPDDDGNRIDLLYYNRCLDGWNWQHPYRTMCRYRQRRRNLGRPVIKRGIDADYMLLLRISWGTTTLMDAFTVANIMNRLARAEGELKGAYEGNRSMRTECEFWREQCKRRDEEMGRLSGRLLQYEQFVWADGALPPGPERMEGDG